MTKAASQQKQKKTGKQHRLPKPYKTRLDRVEERLDALEQKVGITPPQEQKEEAEEEEEWKPYTELDTPHADKN